MWELYRGAAVVKKMTSIAISSSMIQIVCEEVDEKGTTVSTIEYFKECCFLYLETLYTYCDASILNDEANLWYRDFKVVEGVVLRCSQDIIQNNCRLPQWHF